MGQYETIRGNVADVYVVNDDIATTAEITQDKLAASNGFTFSGTLVSASVSGYVTLVTVTSNTTFFFGAVQVTAAGTSSGVSLTNSAGTGALVNEIKISAAAANYTNFDTALSTTKILEITAGGSLCALYTSSTKTSGFVAKWFVMCTTTP